MAEPNPEAVTYLSAYPLVGAGEQGAAVYMYMHVANPFCISGGGGDGPVAVIGEGFSADHSS
jgi:hypothetical protein